MFLGGCSQAAAAFSCERSGIDFLTGGCGRAATNHFPDAVAITHSPSIVHRSKSRRDALTCLSSSRSVRRAGTKGEMRRNERRGVRGENKLFAT